MSTSMDDGRNTRVNFASTPEQLAGRTFRMMRETHRLTLRQVAASVGVSHSHLARVESGHRAAGVDLTDDLVNFYATTPVSADFGHRKV